MKAWKWILPSLVLLSLASWYWWSGRVDTRKADVQWKTAILELGDISTVVTATGNISAVTTVQVGTQVSGTISKLLVDYNSVVRKGQIIAMLDTTLLSASRVDAEAARDKAKSQLQFTTQELKRTESLLHGEYASQSDYDQAKSNNDVALATLKSAEAQLHHAIVNLEYATIRAPINGTVISRNVDVGQTVIASMNAPTLFSIANDLTKMQVQAHVDQADIGMVKEHQLVVFSVDAYPNRIFHGTVQQVRLQPVMVQNVVNYVVIIDVDNRDGTLLPGLTASVRIQVEHHDGVLRCPLAALHFQPPQSYFDKQGAGDSASQRYRNRKVSALEIPKPGSHCLLWLQAEAGRLRPVEVTVGLNDGFVAEVQGDCRAGDVVISGTDESAKNGNASADQTRPQNPFMPQMPSSRRAR